MKFYMRIVIWIACVLLFFPLSNSCSSQEPQGSVGPWKRIADSVLVHFFADLYNDNGRTIYILKDRSIFISNSVFDAESVVKTDHLDNIPKEEKRVTIMLSRTEVESDSDGMKQTTSYEILIYENPASNFSFFDGIITFKISIEKAILRILLLGGLKPIIIYESAIN